MKFFENRFEEYLESHHKNSLHPSLEKHFSKLDINDNLIIYGAPGIGKYTQALRYIERYSPTNLKYERKMNISLSKEKNYIFKISDIHFEIDMGLLGCNARILWNEIYKSIVDIVKARPGHKGIILCKNFNTIHNELLDTFYSYMQTREDNIIKLSYILITESYSFIPNNISNRCILIPIRRPSVSSYKRCLNIKNIDPTCVTNIKLLKGGIFDTPNNKYIIEIKDSIKNYKDIDFLTLRECIYNLFIYQQDIPNNIWLLFEFLSNENIDADKFVLFFKVLVNFFKLYNNNYRPIYHLERLIYNLISIIHELS
tara:strand:+ start:1370 stop:2308 length:939 start_codon:yes stop_codon:yes gene_type:complete